MDDPLSHPHTGQRENDLTGYEALSNHQESMNGFATGADIESKAQDRSRINSNLSESLSFAPAMPRQKDSPSSTTMNCDTTNTAPPKVKRKVTMNDDRRQEGFETPGASPRNVRSEVKKPTFGAKDAIFGSNPTKSVIVHFDAIKKASHQPWVKLFNAIPKLQFDQMCTAQDFKAQKGAILSQRLSSGSITPDPDDQEGLAILGDVSQQLRLNLSGLVSMSTKFVVLVYVPVDEWKFIEEENGESLPNASLRYLVFQTTLDTDGELPLVVDETPNFYLKMLVKSIHDLSFSKLVPKQLKDKVYHFYLIFPPSSADTAKFIFDWIQAAFSQRLCKIYSSQTPGSWNFFVHSPTVEIGTILIHESAITTIPHIPAIKDLIWTNKTYNFWCIGDSTFQYPLFSPHRDSTLGQITATRLLPYGQAILLTPSFLVAEPARAAQFIAWFRRNLAAKEKGTWKLICCSGISNYTFDLFMGKAAERDAHLETHRDKPHKEYMAEEAGLGYKVTSDRFDCHNEIVELLRKDPKNINEDSLYDFSDFEDEVADPVIQADESLDPDDEPALVNWFAGWSMAHIDQFRKFTVLGTGTASKKGAMRIKEMAVTSAVDMMPSGDVNAKPLLEKSDSFETAVATVPNENVPPGTLPRTLPQHNGPLDSPKLPDYGDIGEDYGDSCKVDISRERHSIDRGRPYRGGPGLPPFGTLSDLTSSRRQASASPSECRSHSRRGSTDLTPRRDSADLTPRRGSGISFAKPSPAKRSPSKIESGDHSRRPPEIRPLFTPTATRQIMDMELQKAIADATEDGPQEKRSENEANDKVENIVKKEIRFEPTTEWYKKLKAEGGGWEHMFIDSWDKCFKGIGVRQ